MARRPCACASRTMAGCRCCAGGGISPPGRGSDARRLFLPHTALRRSPRHPPARAPQCAPAGGSDGAAPQPPPGLPAGYTPPPRGGAGALPAGDRGLPCPAPARGCALGPPSQHPAPTQPRGQRLAGWVPPPHHRHAPAPRLDERVVPPPRTAGPLPAPGPVRHRGTPPLPALAAGLDDLLIFFTFSPPGEAWRQ